MKKFLVITVLSVLFAQASLASVSVPSLTFNPLRGYYDLVERTVYSCEAFAKKSGSAPLDCYDVQVVDIPSCAEVQANAKRLSQRLEKLEGKQDKNEIDTKAAILSGMSIELMCLQNIKAITK